MALSQVMSTSNQYIKYTIEVITNSQSISNNTSNVTVRVRAYRTNSYETYGTGTIYCKINGTTYSAAITSSQKINSSGVILFTRTMDVSHNADGSKSLTSSAWISHSQFTSSEQSYTTSLTTIPRASSFTATNSGGLDAGSSTTITINRASSSFTHNLYFKLGSTQTTIGTGVGTSVTYTIPSTIINQITTSTSGTGIITCDTYNGSTKIGTSTLNFTVKVPSSVVPTFTSITATRVDNGVPSSWGIYVKGYSKCGLAITGASGVSGSTITSYSITGGGYSYTTQSATTGVINSTGTITFTGKITDSRGRTASKTVSITVYDYSAPVISSSSVSRCLSDGTVDLINGTYLKALCNYSFSSVNSKNTCSASVKWKLKTDSNYGSSVALSNNVSKVVGGGAIAIISQYDVQITVTDSLRSVTKTFGVQTTAVTMDYRSGGKGVALGKISEKDGFEVDWISWFNKGASFYETLGLRGAYGSDLITFFTERPWTFKQGGTGSTSSLDLVSSSSDKRFNILSPTGNGISINVSDTAGISSMAIDNNNVFHSGNCTTGTTTDQQWWRFDNGLQIIRQNKTLGNMTLSYQWGSLYTQGGMQTNLDNFAVAFASAPHVVMDVETTVGTCFLLKSMPATTTWPGSYEVTRGISGSLEGVSIRIIAIGRWK